MADQRALADPISAPELPCLDRFAFFLPKSSRTLELEMADPEGPGRETRTDQNKLEQTRQTRTGQRRPEKTRAALHRTTIWIKACCSVLLYFRSSKLQGIRATTPWVNTYTPYSMNSLFISYSMNSIPPPPHPTPSPLPPKRGGSPLLGWGEGGRGRGWGGVGGREYTIHRVGNK